MNFKPISMFSLVFYSRIPEISRCIFAIIKGMIFVIKFGNLPDCNKYE